MKCCVQHCNEEAIDELANGEGTTFYPMCRAHMAVRKLETAVTGNCFMTIDTDKVRHEAKRVTTLPVSRCRICHKPYATRTDAYGCEQRHQR